MTVGVVDLLEAVEIEKQDRETVAGTFQPVDGALEFVIEQDAVADIGKAVVMGHVFDPAAGLAGLGDVAPDATIAGKAPLFVEDGLGAQRPDAGFAILHDADLEVAEGGMGVELLAQRIGAVDVLQHATEAAAAGQHLPQLPAEDVGLGTAQLLEEAWRCAPEDELAIDAP